MAQRTQYAALIIPGLFDHLWRTKIREFEYDPRLTALGMPDDTAEELEAKRKRVVARETARLSEMGIGIPRERHAAGEVFRFARWHLGGNTFGDDYIRTHPLVSDRSVRWLKVDAEDLVTLGESPIVR